MIYDAIGNPLEYRNGWKCEWSRGHRLDKIENSGYNVNVMFKYDENGIRNRKVVNGVQTDFITSGIKLLGQKTGENVLLWQVDGNGNTIGFNYNNIPYFYMKNLQGDIIGITDASGNIVAKYTYDSWGKLISIKDASDVDKTTDTTFIGYINPLRYRGYYYDSEIGLYYLNARYYDPETGRFINADETLDSGYNLFKYCTNNAINYVDLTGEVPVLIHYMSCIGADYHMTGFRRRCLYNCWNNVTNKIDGVYEPGDPPGYAGNRAGRLRTNRDLELATLAGLAGKNVRNATLLGPRSDAQLLNDMLRNTSPDRMLVALRQDTNPGGDYHYMVYYNGEWTQKCGESGMLLRLEQGITPNADIVWCAHWGDYRTGDVFWESDSTVPLYVGPTSYIEVIIR